MRRLIQSLSAFAIAVTVVACGGGGGTAAPTVPVATLSITGTAATGAAVAGAAVEAKCNGGTGTATTAADGTYTITLTTGSLPCVLKVTTPTGALYSVATGTGTTVKANITPFTQLIVANLLGSDPAAFFTAFTAANATTLSATAVAAAQVKVVDILKSNGIDASTVGDLLAGSLVAASGSVTGNAMDKLLDSLSTKLAASSVTLADLTVSVQQATATATPTGVVSLPAELALRSAAITCSALRSGSYQLVVPQVGTTGTFGSQSTEKITMDAPSLTAVSTSDGGTTTLSALSGIPCRFSITGTGDLAVAQSGVFAFKSKQGRLGIGFPVQNIALADLAGDWNLLGYERDVTGPWAPASANVTVGSAGQFTVTKDCAGTKICTTPGNGTGTAVVNAAGGFDLVFGPTDKGRMFAYRAGGGEIMLVIVNQDGGFEFGTRVRTLTLPTFNAASQGWFVSQSNYSPSVGVYDMVAGNVQSYANTITAVVTADVSIKRNNVTDFTPITVTTRPETIFLNTVVTDPRNGYSWRKPEAVLNSLNATVNVPETVFLGLRGTGVTFSTVLNANPGGTSVSLSIARP